ncbi:MAG: carboxypeptidase regulatory-like domain-containing protein [Planctomycetes bacterium]|nr:carboxypeptidase regulatory-like domain-containing protein [Planctomycetota bacterium]
MPKRIQFIAASLVAALVVALALLIAWQPWVVTPQLPGASIAPTQDGKLVPVNGGDADELVAVLRSKNVTVETADPAAAPKPGAPMLRVRLVSKFTMANPLIAVSEGAGNGWTVYRSDHIEIAARDGGSYLVRGVADGHFVQNARDARAGELVELSLEAYGGLEGVVQSDKGATVTDGAVSLAGVERGESYTTASAEDGRFKFPRLPAGKYKLVARAKGYLSSPTLEVEVVPLMVSTGHALVVTQTPQVEGMVRDAVSGAALGGVRVELIDRASGVTVSAAVTGDDGRFAMIARSKADLLRVVVSRIGYAHQDTDVRAPFGWLAFDLQPDGVPLTITVTDSVDGRLLAGAEVELLGRVAAGNDSPPALVAVADEKGMARFPLVSKGVYRVDVQCEGYVPLTDRFSVASGPPARLALKLDPASRIRVDLTDQHGAPLTDGIANSHWIAYPAVGSFDRSRHLPQDSSTGAARSEFTVTGLPVGEYDLYFFAYGYLPCHASLTVPPGERFETNLTLSLQPRKPAAWRLELVEGVRNLEQPPQTRQPEGDLHYRTMVEETCVVEGNLQRGAGRVIASRARSDFFADRGYSRNPVHSETRLDGESLLDATEGATLVLPTGQVLPLFLQAPGVLAVSATALQWPSVAGVVDLASVPGEGKAFVALCPVHDSALDTPAINAMDCMWAPVRADGSFLVSLAAPDHYALVLFRGVSGRPDGTHAWQGLQFHVPVNLTRGDSARVSLPRQ